MNTRSAREKLVFVPHIPQGQQGSTVYRPVCQGNHKRKHVYVFCVILQENSCSIGLRDLCVMLYAGKVPTH
jgi:hypothetical protein